MTAYGYTGWAGLGWGVIPVGNVYPTTQMPQTCLAENEEWIGMEIQSRRRPCYVPQTRVGAVWFGKDEMCDVEA
jgi:hypothetical protein